jgi:hypothetical protein
MDKIKIAKQLLADEKDDLTMAQEFIDQADQAFFGKALEKEIARWTKDKEQREIKIEALEMLIKEEEAMEQQAADHDREEAEAERIAENAQEHAAEMQAEELQLKDIPF